MRSDAVRVDTRRGLQSTCSGGGLTEKRCTERNSSCCYHVEGALVRNSSSASCESRHRGVEKDKDDSSTFLRRSSAPAAHSEGRVHGDTEAQVKSRSLSVPQVGQPARFNEGCCGQTLHCDHWAQCPPENANANAFLSAGDTEMEQSPCEEPQRCASSLPTDFLAEMEESSVLYRSLPPLERPVKAACNATIEASHTQDPVAPPGGEEGLLSSSCDEIACESDALYSTVERDEMALTCVSTQVDHGVLTSSRTITERTQEIQKVDGSQYACQPFLMKIDSAGNSVQSSSFVRKDSAMNVGLCAATGTVTPNFCESLHPFTTNKGSEVAISSDEDVWCHGGQSAEPDHHEQSMTTETPARSPHVHIVRLGSHHNRSPGRDPLNARRNSAYTQCTAEETQRSISRKNNKPLTACCGAGKHRPSTSDAGVGMKASRLQSTSAATSKSPVVPKERLRAPQAAARGSPICTAIVGAAQVDSDLLSTSLENLSPVVSQAPLEVHPDVNDTVDIRTPKVSRTDEGRAPAASAAPLSTGNRPLRRLMQSVLCFAENKATPSTSVVHQRSHHTKRACRPRSPNGLQSQRPHLTCAPVISGGNREVRRFSKESVVHPRPMDPTALTLEVDKIDPVRRVACNGATASAAKTPRPVETKRTGDTTPKRPKGKVPAAPAVDTSDRPLTARGSGPPLSGAQSHTSPYPVRTVKSGENQYITKQVLLPPLASSSERERTVTIVFDLDETLCNNRCAGPALLRPGAASLLQYLRSTYARPIYASSSTEVSATSRLYLDALKNTGLRPFSRQHSTSVREGHGKHIPSDALRAEIVLWTASMELVARPVIALLDSHKDIFDEIIYRDIRWYREWCCTKDLRRLGRPMDRIVIIENSPASVALNRAQALLVLDFVNNTKDRQLYIVRHILSQWLEKNQRVLKLRSKVHGRRLQSSSVSLNEEGGEMVQPEHGIGEAVWRRHRPSSVGITPASPNANAQSEDRETSPLPTVPCAVDTPTGESMADVHLALQMAMEESAIERFLADHDFVLPNNYIRPTATRDLAKLSRQRSEVPSSFGSTECGGSGSGLLPDGDDKGNLRGGVPPPPPRIFGLRLHAKDTSSSLGSVCKGRKLVTSRGHPDYMSSSKRHQESC